VVRDLIGWGTPYTAGYATPCHAAAGLLLLQARHAAHVTTDRSRRGGTQMELNEHDRRSQPSMPSVAWHRVDGEEEVAAGVEGGRRRQWPVASGHQWPPATASSHGTRHLARSPQSFAPLGRIDRSRPALRNLGVSGGSRSLAFSVVPA